MNSLSRARIVLMVMAIALSGLGAVHAAPDRRQSPHPDTQPVRIGGLVFSAPAGWLTWTYDDTRSEKQNEQDLLTLVKRVDPALVEDATPIVQQNVPEMIAAAFAPDAPGGDLVYITLIAYGYQASLKSLGLGTQAKPAQVITALGFPKVEQSHALTAGFSLEESKTDATFTGGFALPDQDRIVLMIGGADARGWQVYGDAIQAAIRSFALDEPAGAAPAGDLQTGGQDPAQLPVLTPANPQYLYPYEFSAGTFRTGDVDLTRQPIDPILEKIEGTDIVPPVVGYVTAQPTFAFYAQPNPGGTVGVVFAGNNYVDTVLLLHCPNGEWHFADDVKWANADPAVAANQAQEGVYEVWIGSKQPAAAVSGALYVLVQ